MTREEAINELAGMYRIAVVDSLDATVEANKKNEAIDMAISALKAQEPRVMTLEYFDNSPDKDSKGCLVAWVEYRRDEEWAEYWEDTCDEWSVIRRDDFYSGESYRFWTSRPDEKRRAETPWN